MNRGCGGGWNNSGGGGRNSRTKQTGTFIKGHAMILGGNEIYLYIEKSRRTRKIRLLTAASTRKAGLLI